MDLVYKNEKTLFKIILVFSVLFWLLLLIGTFGGILVFVVIGFLLYLFAQSGFISVLKGNGVQVTEQQMPALHKQFHECCDILEIEKRPELYVLNSEGFLNALAARFLRKHYVVLYSGVVGALQKFPDGINFYIGHELGHIKRGHLNLAALILPGSLLPVVGPAYSRAREYSSDLHGLKCCKKPKYAIFAMAVLASGAEQWTKLNMRAYADQSSQTGSFWMSFHELTADYPWLSKRMQHLLSKASNQETSFPKRSVFAYFLAMFVPRSGAGTGGFASLFPVMMVIAVIGILASIALPAYQDYVKRAEVAVNQSYSPKSDEIARVVQIDKPGDQQSRASNYQGTVSLSADRQAKEKVINALRIANDLERMISQHIYQRNELPKTLRDIGVRNGVSTAEIRKIELTPHGFILHLRGDEKLEGKTVVFDSLMTDGGEVSWDCTAGSLERELRAGPCSTGS